MVGYVRWSSGLRSWWQRRRCGLGGGGDPNRSGSGGSPLACGAGAGHDRAWLWRWVWTAVARGQLLRAAASGAAVVLGGFGLPRRGGSPWWWHGSAHGSGVASAWFSSWWCTGRGAAAAGLSGVGSSACGPWGCCWSLSWMQVVASPAPRAVERVAGLGQVLIQAESPGWSSGVTFGEVVGEMGGADAVGPPVTGRGARR